VEFDVQSNLLQVRRSTVTDQDRQAARVLEVQKIVRHREIKETKTMRQKARTDGNHKPIMQALRKAGYKVISTHQAGSGFPDLVVIGKTGKVAILMEDKTRESMTPDEVEFILKLVDPVYRMAFSPEQAVEIMQSIVD
jgi:hypothetical protein